MGICLSKKRPSLASKRKRMKLKAKENRSAAAAGAPPHSLLPRPPPPEEEAVVKQVLTETPSAPPRLQLSLAGVAVAADHAGRAEDRSDAASESCSFSESFVSATPPEREEAAEIAFAGPHPGKLTSLAEKARPRRHHHHQPQQRQQLRSPVRPARPHSPAAIRRDQGERSGRMSASPATVRKDPGERSGRRAASPAARRAIDRSAAGSGGAVSRSSSMRKVAAPPPSSQEESVENPLVSLECFIFL